MEVLRTPDERFNDLKEYPFEPHYTNIKTHDGTTLEFIILMKDQRMAQYF